MVGGARTQRGDAPGRSRSSAAACGRGRRRRRSSGSPGARAPAAGPHPERCSRPAGGRAPEQAPPLHSKLLRRRPAPAVMRGAPARCCVPGIRLPESGCCAGAMGHVRMDAPHAAEQVLRCDSNRRPGEVPLPLPLPGTWERQCVVRCRAWHVRCTGYPEWIDGEAHTVS